MQIYFHSRLCSYLPRVPILVDGTVYIFLTDQGYMGFLYLELIIPDVAFKSI